MFKRHNGEIDKIKADELLKKMGVVPVKAKIKPEKDEIGIKTVGNSSEIDLNDPYVYWDTQLKIYAACVDFYWQNEAWDEDFDVSYFDQWFDVGGYDGIAIATSRKINVDDTILTVYDTSGGHHTYDYASKKSDHGAGYHKQDEGILYSAGFGDYDYNWDHGYLDIFFTSQEPGEEMAVWAEFAHTWSDSDVSITGISSSGVSWNVTNSNYEWDIVSGSTLYTP